MVVSRLPLGEYDGLGRVALSLVQQLIILLLVANSACWPVEVLVVGGFGFFALCGAPPSSDLATGESKSIMRVSDSHSFAC